MNRIFLALVFLLTAMGGPRAAEPRPNILWITSEDNGPQLGCYGDAYAETPHLDAFARRSLRFLHVWSVAPVCAPARTAIISGLYPSATGSEHMRSLTRLPAGMKMFPQLLREAGYYCSNNSKEDYNLAKTGKVWDESSAKAHWRNRERGQPFFAVFNHTITHESQVRRHEGALRHDPAKVRVPAYHPDTPEVRRDWARYYDRITEMDTLAGRNLAELEAAGLAEDTIVFYFGDHGAGMPRSKRWPYNSGLQVPLIVHVPEKFGHLAPADYRAGGQSARLVSFVDLAPAVLSAAGIRPPGWMQGRAFLGRFAAPAPEYLHGLRGRMDERYDLVRSVRDERFVYIRNFMPHEIYGQYLDYMFQTPTTRIWRQLFEEGRLNEVQRRFWEPKPAEELYDLQTDRDEIHNLAASAAHQGVLRRLRRAQRKHLLDIRDVGFLPEGEIHSRSGDASPYEIGHRDAAYPLRRILDTAELASAGDAADVSALKRRLRDRDSAVRHWAALGLLMRGERAAQAAGNELKRALQDESPYVRATAAEVLARYGDRADRDRAVDVLLELSAIDRRGVYVAMWALNALDAVGARSPEARLAIQALPAAAGGTEGRVKEYVPRLLEALRAKP